MDPAVLSDLIYELSLATSRPFPSKPYDLTRATAAAEALSSYMECLRPQELKLLEYTLGPLLFLLQLANKTTFTSIEPVAITAATSIIRLLPSRRCMSSFVAQQGLRIMFDIFDDLFSNPDLDLVSTTPIRSLIEQCAIIYREIARYYPNEVVSAGALRFFVQMLRTGDVVLKTIAAATVAALSTHLDICKQLFSYGVVKPLLLACDTIVTNEACTLSGLGCITQMCRIPEIAIIIVKQGAIPVLLQALRMKGTYSNDLIHEKALFGLSCISRIPELKAKLNVDGMQDLLRMELKEGTSHAKYTVLRMLLDLHGTYPNESEFLKSVADSVVDVMREGTWHAKNIAVKAICVLYKSDDEMKWYFQQNHVIKYIFAAMKDRTTELQEAFLVGLLTLCTHPDIPRIFIAEGGIEVLAPMVGSADPVVNDLAVVLLKGIALYDRTSVEEAVAEEYLYYFANFASDDYDVDQHTYTAGGMIDEFLLTMVENRRDEHYLLQMYPEYTHVVEQMKITPQELESYENTFYELDPECRGELGLTELKILGVMMGEKFDEEELEELLTRHDTDKSGSLDFVEYIVMMQNWFSANEHGDLVQQIAHDTTQRGPIAKARRAFLRFWNRDREEQRKVLLTLVFFCLYAVLRSRISSKRMLRSAGRQENWRKCFSQISA